MLYGLGEKKVMTRRAPIGRDTNSFNIQLTYNKHKTFNFRLQLTNAR